MLLHRDAGADHRPARCHAGARNPNPHGTDLLDRLEDWGARSDRLMPHGCPELSSRK